MSWVIQKKIVQAILLLGKICLINARQEAEELSDGTYAGESLW